MADSAVRAHASAVDDVAQAVAAFVTQETEVLDSARTSLIRQIERTQSEMQRRRQVLERARLDSARADAALAQCQENCGGLAQAAAAARRRHAEAGESLARARQADLILSEALAKLAAATRTSGQVCALHGRSAIEQCRLLAKRLREVLGMVVGVAEFAGVAMNVTAGIPAVNRLEGLPTHQTTIAESASERAKDQNRLWGDAKEVELEKRAGDTDRR